MLGRGLGAAGKPIRSALLRRRAAGFAAVAPPRVPPPPPLRLLRNGLAGCWLRCSRVPPTFVKHKQRRSVVPRSCVSQTLSERRRIMRWRLAHRVDVASHQAILILRRNVPKRERAPPAATAAFWELSLIGTTGGAHLALSNACALVRSAWRLVARGAGARSGGASVVRGHGEPSPAPAHSFGCAGSRAADRLWASAGPLAAFRGGARRVRAPCRPVRRQSVRAAARLDHGRLGRLARAQGAAARAQGGPQRAARAR